MRCVCTVSAVPEPSVAFELPSRNLTVTEGHRDFAAAPGGPEGSLTGILTLRGALEPRLAVLCAARNAHGTTARQLRFHHPGQSPPGSVSPLLPFSPPLPHHVPPPPPAA